MTPPTPGQRNRRWIGIGVILILVCLLLIVGALSQADSLARRLAQQRWQAQGITHYQMAISLNAGLDMCDSEYVVDGGTVSQVVSTNPADCSSQYTVEDLFRRIEHYQSPRGSPKGCACDGTIGMTVDYDPELGYPAHILVDIDTDRRWVCPAAWETWVNGTGCARLSEIRSEITVESLRKLP